LRLTFAAVGRSQQAELLDLWVDSWAEVDPTIDFAARRPWFAEHLAQWQSRGALCIGAWDDVDARLAGFILLDPVSGHLDQICVRRDLKGRTPEGSGVAQTLLGHARQLSPAGITLDVNAMNHRAIRFYVREGFVKTGEGVNPRSGLPLFHCRWQP
jgi:putative acetyltransferase